MGGSPGMKMSLYTAQARCSKLSMSAMSTRGMCHQGCCSASWYSHATPCTGAMPRPRPHKQQHVAHRHHWPHTPEYVHGIEHHAKVHAIPFLFAGHAHLMIICQCLKICKTFIDIPPKMLVIFAKCGTEAPPKDGSKPAKKNQII